MLEGHAGQALELLAPLKNADNLSPRLKVNLGILYAATGHLEQSRQLLGDRVKDNDLSALTRQQASDFVNHHEGRLCARFFERADGTLLTSDCSQTQRPARRLTQIAAAAVWTAISIGLSMAAPAQSALTITVIDSTGARVSGAEVVIRDQSDGVTIKSQRLRWIDGERLCVTRPLFAACEGQIPAWLRIASRDRVPWPRLIPVNLPRIGGGWLFHFPNAPVWKRWLGKAVGRPMRPASVRHSGLAFRLARYGVPTSQLLAFGGREDGGGFLLLRAPTQCRGLREWLALPRPARRTLIYRLGQTLHRAHAAGCRGLCCRNLVVEPTTGGRGRMRLVTDGSLRRCSNIDRADAVRDLRRLARELGLARPDVARMIRGYFAGQVIDAGRLRLAAAVLGFTHGRSP
jgi:hypothetical protein